MYTLIMILGFSAAYVSAYFFFPWFFGHTRAALAGRSLVSLAAIITFFLVVVEVTFGMADPWWGNRLLHALGGGFLAFITCMLASRDAGVRTSPLRLLVLALLVTTALGVGNEVLEMGLQHYVGLRFATSPMDTWLDLLSNTAGMLFAALATLPFLRYFRKAA